MLNRIIKYINSYQLFQLLRYASIIIPTIFFSKYFYSKEEIGLYESFLLFSSVFSFFWLSAIFSTILSDDQQEVTKKKNIKVAFAAIQFISIGMVVILLISNFIHPYIEQSYLYALVCYILINNPAFIIENAFLLFKKKNELIYYGISYFIVQLIGSFILVYEQADIIYIIYWLLGVACLRYIYACYMILQLNTRIEMKSISLLILKSSPLLLSFFIAGIAEYIDAFLIKYHFGNATLTIYRYGAREIPFVMILANALSISMIPAIRDHIDTGIAELKRRSSYLMHISFIGTILLVLTCTWWYPILFSNQFLDSIPYFLISSLLIISRCVFPQTILQANRATKAIMYISIFELILNVLLSLLFLSMYGAIGVLYGTLISFTLEKIILSIYVKVKLKINIKSYIPIPLFIVYIVLLLCSIAFQHTYLN